MRKGFTLIELMIVIAIIAIIAAIAIPNLLESRISSNEAAAASTLKSGVLPGEVQFQAGGYRDTNSNGIGDFSPDFDLMAGLTSTAGPTLKLSLLPAQWNNSDGYVAGALQTSGMVTINGYVFDCDCLTEINFVADTWPNDQKDSIGRRTFAINAGGQVYSTAPSSVNLAFIATGALSAFGASMNSPNTASGWAPYRR